MPGTHPARKTRRPAPVGQRCALQAHPARKPCRPARHGERGNAAGSNGVAAPFGWGWVHPALPQVARSGYPGPERPQRAPSWRTFATGLSGRMPDASPTPGSPLDPKIHPRRVLPLAPLYPGTNTSTPSKRCGRSPGVEHNEPHEGPLSRRPFCFLAAWRKSPKKPACPWLRLGLVSANGVRA